MRKPRVASLPPNEAAPDSWDALIERAVKRAVAEALKAAPREWLSLEQFAAYIGFKPATIYNYLANGTAPPSVKLASNARRFRRSDIDAWILNGGALRAAEGITKLVAARKEAASAKGAANVE